MRIAIVIGIGTAASACCWGAPLAGAADGGGAADAGIAPSPSAVGTSMPIEAAPIDPVPVAAPTVAIAARGEAAAAQLGRGWQPQVAGARELYDGARPHEGAIDRGMLVCRVRVHGGGWDDSVLAGGPDVAIVSRIGDGAVRDTPHSDARVYSIPVARLRAGESIWMRVIDRDVFFHDTIAEGSARYERTPLVMTMGQADVECRAVDPALVARRADDAIARAARAIDRLEDAEPDVLEPALGHPDAEIAPVMRHAEEATAWIAPSDPELAEQLERLDAFESDWSRRAVAAVESATRELPPPGTPVVLGTGRSAHLAEVACGLDATALRDEIGDAMSPADGYAACLLVIDLEIGRTTTLPAVDRDRGYLEAWGLDRSATALPATVVARRHTPRGAASDAGRWATAAEALVVAPGDDVDLVLAIARGARVLRVRDGARAVAMRIE